MTADPHIDTYGQAAREKFDLLKDAYGAVAGEDLKGFWKFGNSFDTMIDFLDIDSSSADSVAELVDGQFTASLNALGGYDNAWFDDFGWWTIATQRALDRPYFSATAKSQFAELQSSCWTRFTGNAPEVWARHPPNKFLQCQPAVGGGVWNAYWDGTDEQYLGPRGNPTSGALGGIQNTVTNTLYLIAAQRLGVTDSNARRAADLEYSFLRGWLWSEKPSLCWNPPKSPAAATLIRERVSHFSDGSLAPEFQANWAWTGDQGLILGAITDRLSEDGDRRLAELAKGLLLAARTSLTDNRGVLQSWIMTKGSGYVPSSDTADYCTGAGVFWRNALYAWKRDSELRACLSERDYQTFIGANADAVVAGTAWPPSDHPLDRLTKDVAVLVAAINMLGA